MSDVNKLGVLPPRKTILLTGAGFSKPFGGLLANEMWAAILTQPETSQVAALRELLLSDLDYESLYNTVLTDARYTQELRRAFTDALRKAYLGMDDAIRTHAANARRLCQGLLARFAPAEHERERGFVFTLNQDLLVERYHSGNTLLKSPGFASQLWFTGRFGNPLERRDREQVPSEQVLDTRKRSFRESETDRFVYVKLHGSLAWKGLTDEDIMVIGTSKPEQIESYPLLAWYFSLFRSVLSQPTRNLVVVGYGFRDQHINDAIADAILASELRLYIVSQESPSDFKSRLFPVHGTHPSPEPSRRGKDLWRGLYGYHCGSVEDLYHHFYSQEGLELPAHCACAPRGSRPGRSPRPSS